MDYGNIFVGTFGTIWRHKRLWLFGLLGQALATIGGLISGALALSALGPWFEAINRMIQSNGSSPNFPAEVGSFFARLAGGLAIAFLLWLAGYVINLIMRGATIGEAAVAWAGRRTDTGRGLREGGSRALNIFALDLLWYVPLWLVIGVVYIGGFIAWITSLGLISGSNNQFNGAPGWTFFLGFCGLLCCLLVFGVLLAAFFGTFAPLMYQAAVQGRRSMSEAVSEGWRLARTHLGPMLVFWILLLLVMAASWLVVTVINYPVSMAYMGPWMQWMTRIMQQAQSGGQVVPAMPPLNTGSLLAGLLVRALISLLATSFVQTFGLTMYAEVYRRLAGGAREAEATPAPWMPAAPAAAVPGEPLPVAPSSGGVRVYEEPAGQPPDLGLRVGDEPEDDGNSLPAA